MNITTRFGAPVREIRGAEEDTDGRLWVDCLIDYGDGRSLTRRECLVSDLRAPGGLAEIMTTIEGVRS